MRAFLAHQELGEDPSGILRPVLLLEHEGRVGRFAVARPAAERVIHSSVEIDDGPTIDQTWRLRARWPSRSLADALTRMGDDPVYRRALRGALELVS